MRRGVSIPSLSLSLQEDVLMSQPASDPSYMVLPFFGNFSLMTIDVHLRLTLNSFFFRPREPVEDRLIGTFDEHEDSVYIVEWSAADPWIFASLSYDGRIVINRVPRAEKYKILL